MQQPARGSDSVSFHLAGLTREIYIISDGNHKIAKPVGAFQQEFAKRLFGSFPDVAFDSEMCRRLALLLLAFAIVAKTDEERVLQLMSDIMDRATGKYRVSHWLVFDVVGVDHVHSSLGGYRFGPLIVSSVLDQINRTGFFPTRSMLVQDEGKYCVQTPQLEIRAINLVPELYDRSPVARSLSPQAVKRAEILYALTDEAFRLQLSLHALSVLSQSIRRLEGIGVVFNNIRLLPKSPHRSMCNQISVLQHPRRGLGWAVSMQSRGSVFSDNLASRIVKSERLYEWFESKSRASGKLFNVAAMVARSVSEIEELQVPAAVAHLVMALEVLLVSDEHSISRKLIRRCETLLWLMRPGEDLAVRSAVQRAYSIRSEYVHAGSSDMNFDRTMYDSVFYVAKIGLLAAVQYAADEESGISDELLAKWHMAIDTVWTVRKAGLTSDARAIANKLGIVPERWFETDLAEIITS